MDSLPKYFRFDRRVIGVMVGAKRVLDNLTRVSIAGSGISAMATVLVGGKIDLILPIVAAVIGLVTTTTRDLLSFIIDASEIFCPSQVKNPILISTTQTVEQPTPIEAAKLSGTGTGLPADAEVRQTTQRRAEPGKPEQV